jgi:type II secretory pathway pseudopilin PulG
MKNKSKKGFTVLELILYVGISGIMLFIVSLFLATVLESRVKNQTVSEVNQAALVVTQIITQIIRNAVDINFPLAGTNATSASIGVFETNQNPTIIDEASGTIRITEGENPPVPLINSRVLVSNLLFQNLSRPNASSVIRIQFTLTHINPEGRNEYDYAETFYSSAGLRQK